MSNGSNRRGLPTRLKMRHDTHFVEELTVRDQEPIGRMVLLEAVEPDPSQPRSLMGDLTELVASVRDKGVLEPILVRPNPDSSQDGAAYRIISGERRFHAAKAAGLVEVPVIEMQVDEQEALEIALVENLQRKDLTPFEEGEGYRRLSDIHGYTHERIADAVGKSRTVVTESLNLLDMPPRVREAAVGLGVLSKSVLLEVLRATSDADEMVELLERVASRGWTRDDLRRVGRQRPSGEAQPQRKKPYTFKFKAPDKTYNLSLSFRRSTVDRTDLISALEEILDQLRSADDSGL